MKKSSKQILRNKEELRKLYINNGVHHTARELMVGLNTVRRWLDRHGIKRLGQICKMPDKSFLNRRKPTTFITSGYRFIREPGKKEVFEHRHIMENIIGRKLDKKEIVHHINGDKLDNRPDNLILCKSQGEHMKLHNSIDVLLKDLIKHNVIYFDRVDRKYKLCTTTLGESVPLINLSK